MKSQGPTAASIPTDLPASSLSVPCESDDIPTLGWEEEQWETLDQYWNAEDEDEEIEEFE